MFQRPASLRYSLIIVFVLGLIPCVGLTLYGNIQQRRLCLAKAQESVFLSAVDLAEVLGLVIDQTHHMLQALSLEPAVRRLDKKSCPVFFNQNFVKKAFPIYSNLGLANLQGQLVCSAFPGSEVGALSDLSYFKAIINTKQFSVGIDRMTGSRSSKKELFIGYPVFNDSGSLTGVVFASLKVDWLDHLVNHAWAPANATLTVMDAKGNILASSANTEKRIAQAPRESDIVQKVLQKGTGRAQGDDIDGIRKIYGFKQVGGQSGNLYVYVGIPSSDVVVSGNRLLFFDLVWLLIAIIVAILSVWVCTYYIISRQMNTLMTGIHKITAGDLSARTGLDPNKGEIGFLGSAFDKMAQAIQERELEREKIQDALEKEKYFSEMVIDSLPGVFYLFDASGRIIRWNRNTETITGYSAEELSQMRAQDFVPDYERTVLVERIGQALDHGETAMEAHYVTKNGEEIPYYFTGKTIQIDSTKKILGVGLDISDRKKVETALQENEQLLKTILAASPVGIHIAENREIKWANHAWVDMFGFDRESDYVGQSASLLYQSVEEFERVGTVLYRGLKFTDVTETEAKMKRQDGTFFDAVIRISRLARAESQENLIVAVVTDISERKRQEKKLLESEERYRNLVDTMTEGLGLIDENGKIAFVNKQACKMVGYEQHELIGRKIEEFLQGDSRRIILERLSERKTSDSLSYELEWTTRTGEKLYTQVSSKSIWAEDGTFQGSLATATDITERRRYEEQLRDSEKKTRVLIEQAPIGIAIFQKGKYAYANPTLVTMFDCQHPGEIVGRPITEFVAPGHQRLFIERYNRFMSGKPTRPSYQMEGIKNNGGLFDIVLWPKKIDYEEKPAILAFMMDVTENKSLRAQLMQAQKMEAIGTLAGGVAHDFNNLLQVVIGYSELILMDRNLSDKFKQNIKSINRIALNGADLVKRLLTFSRRSETTPKPLNLNDEIRHIKKLLDHTIPKMIEIELDLQENLNLINADSSQVEQIIMNLAVNARDAMPDGGRFVVETENIILDQVYCASHIEAAPGPHVLLSVSDTGHGMNRKTLERIFEPFYTTKGAGKGTGLGLAMVYGIVKQHHGHITCYSEPGTGTTFKIYFPSLVSSTTPEQSDAPIVAQGGSETILLVDDEESVRAVAQELLREAGYQVITVGNPREALAIFERKKDSIALVVLDLIMPEMGGKECLEELLKIDPDVNTLICSGYSVNETAKSVVQIGAKGFIRKPYNSNEILTQIREILDRTSSAE